ncbi:hypothetical protein K7G98_14470 [Saccharothrix sp. MB29]|nr:hypothetical protein [Saccharothrix sp. MB29]
MTPRNAQAYSPPRRPWTHDVPKATTTQVGSAAETRNPAKAAPGPRCDRRSRSATPFTSPASSTWSSPANRRRAAHQ